jgi:hypothetical protein
MLHNENHLEIEKANVVYLRKQLIYYNSTENETQLKKRRYTRKTHLTLLSKKAIIAFSLYLLSSKSHSQPDELFL